MRSCRLLAMMMFAPSALLKGAAPDSVTTPPDGHPRTAYFSVGDNQDLLGLPLDSKVSIETAFDALHDGYQVERIWWRGAQQEIWGKNFVFRPENRLFDCIWKWWRYLAYEGVAANQLAVDAAHERKMPIWAIHNVTDCGAGPDVGYSGFPYAAEDRLRIAHPEYAPVNRWGTWRQGGPVEFAYPKARAAVIDYLVKDVVARGYNGLVLLTYAENYSQHYDDEFGFNEPIVAEFKRRYHIDIRKEDFDHTAWSRLRGEYFTQFLRELRVELGRRSRKLAVCVDGADAELPTKWSAHGGVHSSGLIHMDLATWAQEGLVDEICVWGPRDERAAALLHAMELCHGTSTVVSALRTRGWMPEGTPRVMFLGEDVESGFDYEHYIGQKDETIALAPGDKLEARDPVARRRFLTAVLKTRAMAGTEQLIDATRDADLYVRRLALRALAERGDPAAIQAVEAALRDPENSVRSRAAMGLGELAGARSFPALFDAAARDPSSFQLRIRAISEIAKKLLKEGRLSTTDKQPLIDRLHDASTEIREAALYALQVSGAPATPEVEQALEEIIQSDSSAWAREMAGVNLRSSFGATPRVVAVLEKAAQDHDDAVGMRAMAALALLGQHAAPGSELRQRILAESTEMFRRYGDDSTRSDKDWGWRVLGDALLGFGDEGRAILASLMSETGNRRLAENAWNVLYHPQGDKLYPMTLEQDCNAHAHHPFLNGGPEQRARNEEF